MSGLESDTVKGTLASARVARVGHVIAFARTRLTQPLARASVTALAVYIIGAGLSYLAQVAAARIVGAQEYGIYAFVLALTTLLAYFSTLGFHVSLQRFVPAYRAKEQWSLAAGVIAYAHRAAAITGVLVLLIGYGVTLAAPDWVQSNRIPALLIGLVTIPLIALYLVDSAVVRAFGGVALALTPERVVRDSVMLVALALAAWSGFFRPNAALASGAALVGAIATLIVAFLAMRHLRPEAIKHAIPAYEGAAWRRPTIPLAGITVADNLMTRAAVIVLGMQGEIREAGIFAAALSLATLTSLPRMAVGTVFTPQVSHLYAKADHAGLRSLLARSACLSLLGTIGVAVPLVLLAKPLLALFGTGFTSGAPVVVILVIGQLVSAAAGPQQHLITMTGHERAGATMQMASAVLNLVLCLLMVAPFGMTGVAVAMTIGLVAWNVAMSIFIGRTLGIQPGLVSAARALWGMSRKPIYEEAT